MVEILFTFLVIIGGILLFGVFSFLAHKIYQDRNRISMPVLRTLLIVVFCFIIWIISIIFQHSGLDIPKPLDTLMRIFAASSAQYGAFLYFIAIKGMFQNEHLQSFTSRRGFWVTTLVVAMLIVLDILLGDQISIDSSKRYASSFLSNAEVVLSYVPLLFWDALIIGVYLKGLQHNTRFVDQGRFVLCAVAFSFTFFGLFVVLFNLLLYIIIQNEGYRAFLNQLYHISLVATLLLVALSYILSDASLTRLLSPLATYKTLRQRRQQALLRGLHQTMVKIVPGVQLPCEPVHDLRILIEISDARQVVWSLQQRLQPITPQEEANYLLHLIRERVVVRVPGEHAPPPTSLKNVVKHNVIVAKRLERLQKAV